MGDGVGVGVGDGGCHYYCCHRFLGVVVVFVWLWW